MDGMVFWGGVIFVDFILAFPVTSHLSFIKLSSQVMQKSCRVNFMFGELTDKETMSE